MIPDLDDLVRLAGEHAERVLVKERQPQLLATYLLFSPAGTFIVPCMWRSDIQKQLMVLEVRHLARDRHARAASFVSEGWMVQRSTDKPQWDLPPSQDPKRQEVVIAYATDGAAKKAMRWQIVRDKPGGRVISLVQLGGILSGAMLESRLIDGIIPP